MMLVSATACACVGITGVVVLVGGVVIAMVPVAVLDRRFA
jgi:hypothetical protein